MDYGGLIGADRDPAHLIISHSISMRYEAPSSGPASAPIDNRVASDLGESEEWLSDVANEMDIEDGVIWVYGVGEDGVMAFTDFGIENLIDLATLRLHLARASRPSPAGAARP